MTLHDKLATLQDAQSELTALRNELDASNAEIAGDEDLDAAETAYAEQAEIRAGFDKLQRAFESRIDDISAHITTEEGKLYDGSTTASRELEALQTEVAHLKATRAGVEDELLEVLTEIEEQQPVLDEVTTTVEDLRAKREVRLKDLHAAVTRLATDIGESEVRFEAARAEAPQELLPIFDDLVKRRAGIAVGRLQGINCNACRVSQPASVTGSIKNHERLTRCSSCERMLVG